MRGAARALLIPALALGCARSGGAPSSAPSAHSPPSPCDAAVETDATELEPVTLGEPPWGAVVEQVELRGAPHVPRSLLSREVRTRAGSGLDEATIADDTRRLAELEAFDDVRAEVDQTPRGVRVRFVLRPRRLVGRVEVRGAPDEPGGDYLPLASGELHDRARLSRVAQGLQSRLRLLGHLAARVVTSERPRGDRVDVCVRATPGPRYRIASFEPVGNVALTDAELVALIDDHAGQVNRPGAVYREDLLDRDLLLVAARYYDRGFVQVRIDAPEVRRDDSRHELHVKLPIHEGHRFRVGRIRFDGGLARGTRGLGRIFSVEPGTVFDRSALMAGVERLRAHFAQRGARAVVTPSTELDERRRLVNLNVSVEREE